ncbi:hypothetical protein ECC02_010109 [Trypanosoma cruzi]|uniref:Uncharacterized protein n=1 Tax=Trypanosoma cruzi TaxID=5693 RepID=A0A7J6XRD6_TRYCR|nr:hypothetical protein ECC02_010109 [Trypanosoma cruzi]
MESNRGDERCGRHTQRANTQKKRGQQPGMHRTPHTTHDTHSNPRQQAHTTHSPATTPTHRWRREKQTGAAHKVPPHVHTARAVRRVCSPHGGYAHTRIGAAQKATQQQRNHRKSRDHRTPRGLLVHGKRSHHRSSSTRKVKRKEWNKAAIYSCFFLEGGRCPHMLLLFLWRANLHARIVCWGFLQCAQLFPSLVNFYCVGAANNSICVVPAFRW